MPDTEVRCGEQEEGGAFAELVKYTLVGYGGGLLLGGLLDFQGLHRSAIGQWLVRTLAGEGESILEGLYALRRRIGRRAGTLAEAYGWGKVVGMLLPWVIDWGSRVAGVDVYGVAGFYIPFCYAMTDQIGGNVSGLLFLRRRQGTWGGGFGAYLRHPVMVTGLALILVVPLGLLTARVVGFSPGTQILTALETMIANLCWLPPAVGWWSERRQRRPG